MIGRTSYAVVAAVAIAMSVVGALSGWVGYRLKGGECAARELEVAQAYASHSDTVTEFAREQSEKAEARITRVVREREQATTRAERLRHEIDLRSVSAARLHPDSVRALTAYYDALFPTNGEGTLPGGVPGTAPPGRSSP